MTTDFHHIPVLGREVLAYLAFPEDRPCRMIDGTVGGGGHSAMLLRRYPKLELLGLDRDADALQKAAETLAFAKERVILVRSDYSKMADRMAELDWEKADGILLDIGVSSPQLDRAERGFSWRAEGPLDMRMDQRAERTASRVLNFGSEEELTTIFREYGEIPQARRLAREAVARRQTKFFATTADLVELADGILGRSKPGKLPAPTLLFQALRIAVNDELGELETTLPAALKLLNRGGRLAVISFHSLEDRMVKNFFREEATGCICPPGLPICICKHKPSLELLTRKAVTAQPDELNENPRAASAKLRAVRKL